MGKKIKERRSLGEEVRCVCDETYASEECRGDLDEIQCLIDGNPHTKRLESVRKAMSRAYTL